MVIEAEMNKVGQILRTLRLAKCCGFLARSTDIEITYPESPKNHGTPRYPYLANGVRKFDSMSETST